MSENPTIHRTFRLAQPSFVSKLIAHGSYGEIGLLRSNPSRVFKFCAIDNEDALASIDQEKKILAILGSHQYIIDLYWVNERGLCFEYYPLGSLRDYYKTLQPNLPELVDRIRWCHQSVDAVAYIHSKDIIHNDISARNILLTSSMDIKICDFGFSTMVGEDFTGGPEPRYCRGRPLSEFNSCVLDDLFGLGSLFYEILTGDLPYKDTGSSEVFKRFAAHIFPSLKCIPTEEFAEIIHKCWNEKYQSIVELQNDTLYNKCLEDYKVLPDAKANGQA